jgi:hypothetical protein
MRFVEALGANTPLEWTMTTMVSKSMVCLLTSTSGFLCGNPVVQT